MTYKNMLKHKLIIITLTFLLFFPLILAKELVLITHPLSIYDKRTNYSKALIHMALEKTKGIYGSFQIEYGKRMKVGRSKHALEKGKFIHVVQAATRLEWEKDLIPIRIPIMKGLLGNRIFLIKKQSQRIFSELQNIDELKKLRAGLSYDWSITSVFKQNNFNIVTGSSYEGLFGMLDIGRFDYFPRGISEILEEYKEHKNKFPNINIEKTILLYLPLPVYLFVTPRKPELAKRIELGLNLMIEDGSFDTIFLKFHQDILNQINIKERKIFKMSNKNLSSKTPFDRKELWLNVQDQ